jgi:6-phosphofructokinase
MFKSTKTGLYKSLINNDITHLVLEVTDPLEDEGGFHLVIIKSGSFTEELDNEQWQNMVNEHRLAFVRELTDQEENSNDTGGITFI